MVNVQPPQSYFYPQMIPTYDNVYRHTTTQYDTPTVNSWQYQHAQMPQHNYHHQQHNQQPHIPQQPQVTQNVIVENENYKEEITTICLTGLALFMFCGVVPGIFVWFFGGIWLLNTKSKSAKRYGKALVLISSFLTFVISIPIVVGSLFTAYSLRTIINNVVLK